jgi:hypothetical protein
MPTPVKVRRTVAVRRAQCGEKGARGVPDGESHYVSAQNETPNKSGMPPYRCSGANIVANIESVQNFRVRWRNAGSNETNAFDRSKRRRCGAASSQHASKYCSE